jgi:hypothetical protein
MITFSFVFPSPLLVKKLESGGGGSTTQGLSIGC